MEDSHTTSTSLGEKLLYSAYIHCQFPQLFWYYYEVGTQWDIIKSSCLR